MKPSLRLISKHKSLIFHISMVLLHYKTFLFVSLYSDTSKANIMRLASFSLWINYTWLEISPDTLAQKENVLLWNFIPTMTYGVKNGYMEDITILGRKQLFRRPPHIYLWIKQPNFWVLYLCSKPTSVLSSCVTFANNTQIIIKEYKVLAYMSVHYS